MNTLRSWAARHGVSMAALQELENELGLDVLQHRDNGEHGASEAAVQNNVRLEAASAWPGWRLFRNNSGVLKNDRGRPVRFGLANESPAQNEAFKSSDLIGWESIVITPEHVGSKFARFVAVEVKERGWVYTGDEHEAAQLRFILMAQLAGANAFFYNGQAVYTK